MLMQTLNTNLLVKILNIICSNMISNTSVNRLDYPLCYASGDASNVKKLIDNNVNTL